MRLRCKACFTEAACDCGVGYVTLEEVVLQEIKKTPGDSDRMIAERIGCSHVTVHNARKLLNNLTVQTRTGRDGKTRKMPTRRKEKITPITKMMAASDVLDKGESRPAVAEKYGIGENSVSIAVAEEKGRRDATVDVNSLSSTAQAKLEVAARQQQRRQDIQYEQRVQQGIKEALEDTVLPFYNKRMEEFDQVIKSRKGILTNDEFRLILSCLHPDALPDAKRNSEAFNCIKSKELVLRGEKENPSSSFIVPRTYDELMKMKEEVRARRKNQKNMSRNLPGMN